MSINVQFTILNKKKTNFIELKKEVNFIELMFLKHQKEVKLVKFFPTGGIGQLLWICRVSRPDICHAVSRLASVAHNPGKKHWDMTTYLIQYVGTTSNLGIVYLKNGTERPYGMVDACFGPDYGFCGDNFRSNEGEVHKWKN